MTESIKVSIIIPVYNMEQYLRQCLDSIVSQTLEDIEVICIDDCSTDSSLSILREYAQKDSRFVVVKQEFNQGQGAARNKGIELAKGEYLGFVDPDDWLDTSMYEKMYNQAVSLSSDVVMCEFKRYTEEVNEYSESLFLRNVDAEFKLEYPHFTTGQNLDRSLINSILLVSPHFSWNKIYKRDYINRFNIRFSSHRCYQDVNFVLLALTNSDKISYTDENLYYYRVHLASNLRSRSTRANIFIDIVFYLKKLLQDNNLYELLKHNFEYFVAIGSKRAAKKISDRERKNLISKTRMLLGKKSKMVLKKFMKKYKLPKISIIIPIYNSEKYLEKCLDSVKHQTLGQIQIICVNDCSTDNSQSIVEKYLYDKRFKLINLKINKGPGNARNKGLEKAKGDYIMFLDPDDWLEKNACEVAYNKISANQNDYAVFGYKEYYEDRDEYKVNTYRMEPYAELQDMPHISHKDLDKDFWRTSFAWAQIYNRNFLLDNDITFPKKYLSEDVPFYAKLVTHTNDISVINEPLYNYRIRSSSLSNDRKLWKEIFRSRKKAYKIIVASESSKELLDTYLIFVIRSYLYWFDKFLYQEDDLCETIYGEIRKIFTKYKLNHRENIELIKKYIPYKKFRKIVRYDYKQYKFYDIQNIFSIKNTQKYKVLTICWVKIKFKRNPKNR